MKYSALSFDGVDDYVEIPDSFGLRFDSGSQDFTIGLWIKRLGLIGQARTIFDKRDGGNDGYVLNFQADDTVRFKINAIEIMSKNSITDTEIFHQIVVSIDRDGYGQIFIDGQADSAQVPINNESMSTTAPILIGKGFDGYHTNSIISGFSIYNRALSEAEIKRLYHHKPILDGLVLWLMPQREYKGVWWDRSGNLNHGTIYGATPSSEKFLLRPLR